MCEEDRDICLKQKKEATHDNPNNDGIQCANLRKYGYRSVC